MEEYLDLFISEIESYIRQLDNELLNLEKDNKNHNVILDVFRILHTIKGMAQTMGFEDLGNLAHSVEDLMMEPKTKGEIDKKVVEFLFIVTDYLKTFLQAVRGKNPLPSAKELLQSCQNLKEGREITVGKSTTSQEMGEIRIKIAKLDTLYNLTNELLIIRARLLKLSSEFPNAELQILSETAARLITELQDEVGRLRMLPLSTVFEFFPRWLRDEARKQNKDIDFVINGGELEVDRSIIDILKEPVMHLLRNALDHGIEKKGRILLSALREREFIRISVTDDGKGIDTEQVRKLAIEKKLIDYEAAQRLTTEDLYKFLLRPDFSTKRDVSTVSGRGIGLDIVHSLIVELGGRLEIKSEKGKGTTFTIDLPISLAVIRAIVFRLNGQRFALPLNYVQESFYLNEEAIQRVYRRAIIRLRDHILPLIRIGEKLNCPVKPGKKSVIVVSIEGIKKGFVIDEIIDEEEIVVKKSDALLPASLYSGCSIYADGKPILILDPRGFE
ncbi:MAG: chemotaxis protein CheW [candidate division WOR-3 bacterium]